MHQENVHRLATSQNSSQSKTQMSTSRKRLLAGLRSGKKIFLLKDKVPAPVIVTVFLGATIFIIIFTTAKPSSLDPKGQHKPIEDQGATTTCHQHIDNHTSRNTQTSVDEQIDDGIAERGETLPHVDSCSFTTGFRRRLAATVAEVEREIHRLAGKRGVIDANWSLKLAAVAEELDPRIALRTKSSWDYSARLPGMKPVPQPENGTRHVCPEVYLGPKHSSHYGQTGMKTQKCSYVPDFKNVLTVVLPAISWTPNITNFVIEQIRKFYDVPIIAAVDSADEIEIERNVSKLSVEKVPQGYEKEGRFMNELTKKITTPFILIATSLAHFNNQSSLERLVRVLDELQNVKVVGGAARDLDGHWIHGCLQQRMANYEAHYSMGYYYSKYECMYCDDLLTPFLTTTAFLRKIQFTEDLSGNALYRDWFAKVLVNGHLTMVCPDVMFYVSNHPNITKQQWLKVAKHWSLEKIVSYDGKEYRFDCSSVGITCKNPLTIIQSFLLPPCCRAVMEKYLGYLIDYAKEHNLAHELQVGSALGAMKMDGYLPWDFDMDIIFECKDYETWLKSGKFLKPKHCNPTVSSKNIYITVRCPNFFLELYCHEYNATSQQFLPEEYQHIPTTIKYSGKDVVVSANPGLHTRNRMGIDSLKHAAHWRTLKVSKIGKAKGGYDHPGIWNPCRNPKHHSCLDRYPGDGNLPFKDPFLQL
ncbi:uncharacterized protein [Macrobrachium rosenbergii]|uniref:uncharacterized protein isoform X2 n=1 Tax=Macrobrachium rosenbergii TaxID=79674 RepID=UPI0034D6778A